MKILKKVMIGVLLAILGMPIYAGGVYFSFSPGTVYYSQPAYSGSCLSWVPQYTDEYNNWVPGHYENVCYQPYPYTYYYGYRGNYSYHHHNH